MTDSQWNELLAVVRGQPTARRPVGFIIDSPWLPAWAGHTFWDYFASESVWLESNLRAIEAFPDCTFLPGFWSEFGMCTEPSAFGGKCLFPRNEFPFIGPITDNIEVAVNLPDPDPSTDGLLPLMLGRLRWARPRLEDLGHPLRFSVSRGPLNICTFLMGTTDFLLALKTEPELTHRLLRKATDFLKRWHAVQREAIPTIQGMLVLDDIVGFLSEADFLEFAAPYMRELFATDLPVRFFHNDAECRTSVRHYGSLGINLYNPGIQHSIAELRTMAGPDVALLGGLPPRDVLAAGTPEAVAEATRRLVASMPGESRWMFSCSGGMPPGVPTANIRACIDAARSA